MQGMISIHANKDNLCLYVILGPIGSTHRFPISIGVWKGFVYHWWWPRGMEMIFAMSHPVHCKYCKFALLLFHLITLQYVCFSSWSKWLSCALKSVTFTCMLVTYIHIIQSNLTLVYFLGNGISLLLPGCLLSTSAGARLTLNNTF